MLIFTPKSQTDLAHADVDGTEYLSLAGYPAPVGGAQWETVRVAVTPGLRQQIREMVRSWDVAEMAEAHAAGCEPCQRAERHVPTIVFTAMFSGPSYRAECSCGWLGAWAVDEAEAQAEGDAHSAQMLAESAPGPCIF